MVLEDIFGDKPAGTVNEAISSLGLKMDDAFGYLFDFGLVASDKRVGDQGKGRSRQISENRQPSRRKPASVR